MRTYAPAAKINTLLRQELPQLSELPDGISTWTASSLDDLRRQATSVNKTAAVEAFQRGLFQTIDILGARSQRAQEINEPLTSVARLHDSSTYTLYLLTHQRRGVGILKVGVKKLFLTHPRTQQLVEVDPMCVLDFYVDESCQRQGFGKQLFEEMLANEGVAGAEQLAIDRPSAKFVGFLKKHYGLTDTAPQVNHFVVFTKFFDNTTISERGKLIRAGAANGNRRSGQGPAGAVVAAPVASRYPKNGSPGAVRDGGRASGEIRIANNNNVHTNGGEGDEQGDGGTEAGEGLLLPRVMAPQQRGVGGREGKVHAVDFGLGPGVVPYQPQPRPSLRERPQVNNAVAPATPPKLVPFAVHHRGGSRYMGNDDPRVNAPPPCADNQHRGVGGGRDDNQPAAGRLSNENNFLSYDIQPVVLPGVGEQRRHLGEGGNAGRGHVPCKNHRVPPMAQEQHPQRSPSPQHRQPPSGNAGNFYNGHKADLVVPLSPVRVSPDDRTGDAVGERDPTPQRHQQQQRNARSRVNYNIITGEMC